jgi:hypothetical protein
MADATEVASSHIGEEDVGPPVDGLSRPLEAPPARASSARSIAPSIVTRTSASFGIALLVTSEPTRAIRRTPGQVHAASTNDRTARSSSRRGSATEGLGLWDKLRRMSLDAGLAQSAPLPRADIVLDRRQKSKRLWAISVRFTPRADMMVHRNGTTRSAKAAVSRCSKSHRYSITSSASAILGNLEAERLCGLEIDGQFRTSVSHLRRQRWHRTQCDVTRFIRYSEKEYSHVGDSGTRS